MNHESSHYVMNLSVSKLENNIMINKNNNFSSCPICSNYNIKLIYKFNDFCVVKCQRCLNSWRTNMYTPDKIQELYCIEEYEKHPYFSYENSLVETLRTKRFQNYNRALAYIESVIGVGKILDVACGSGTFLSIADKRGWQSNGVEISPTLCKVCEQNTSANVTNSSFEEVKLTERYYDAITFWDIIEHVLDPVFCIEKAKALLKPGGIVMFCTPNEDSLLASLGWALYKLTGSYYSYPALALHPIYHTYFFSKKGFKKVLLERDLTVISSYSQEAFFEHSPLASPLQKKAIALIENIGSLFDATYELVMFAKS